MKKLFSYILFLFTTVFTYGQVILEMAEVKDQKVNQRFTLTVLLEISGENMEQQTPLQMPDLSKFDIIGSASDRNTVVLDPVKGVSINQLIFQYVLSPKQAGKIKIGSALVTVNGKRYKTEPFDIIVRENERSTPVAEVAEKNDLYLSLEIDEKNVYKNQPTTAVLRAYSREYDNFRKVGKIRIPAQRSVKIKQVSAARSEIEQKNGLASQVLGTFTILPLDAGKISISPITAALSTPSQEIEISSNPTQLNVKKYPGGMPLTFQNAVGQFDLNLRRLKNDEVSELKKPIHLLLKISGKGNLSNLSLPKILQSEQYDFFPPKISSATRPDKGGDAGSVSAEYIVIPKMQGPMLVKFEDFSYLDPDSKSYVDLGSKELIIDVQTIAQIEAAKSTLEKVNDYTNNVLETVNTPVLQTQNFKVKDTTKINWKTVFGNLALLTTFTSLFLIVLRKREKRKLKLRSATSPTTSISETESVIKENLHAGFEDNLDYLKLLKEQRDYKTFFTAYDELKKETREYFGARTESELRTNLAEEKGQKFAEQYRMISEKIQMEKFAPHHSEEQMEEIYDFIQTIYSEIKK